MTTTPPMTPLEIKERYEQEMAQATNELGEPRHAEVGRARADAWCASMRAVAFELGCEAQFSGHEPWKEAERMMQAVKGRCWPKEDS